MAYKKQEIIALSIGNFRIFHKKVEMISKTKLKEHIDKFPKEEISIDELIERLIFIEKLENRIAISEQGKSILSEDSVKEDVEKWSK